MQTHRIYMSSPTDIANEERLQLWYQAQRESNQVIHYLLPSQKWLRKARNTQPALSFITFDDLATNILHKAKVPYIPITEQERILFFQDLVMQTPGLVEGIGEIGHLAKAYADTYGELKRLGLSLDQLPHALQELKPILKKYENEWVQKRTLLDPENRVLTATNCFLDYPPFAQVIIDGYFDFSPLQYRMIIYLVQKGIPVTIYLPTLDSPIIKETQSNLQMIGFQIVDSIPTINPIVQSRALVKATTVEEEIHAIFEWIIEHKDKGRYDNFGIVLVDEAVYENPLKQIAEEKKIPLKVPKKTPLSQTRFLSFLRILLEERKEKETKWDRLQWIECIGRLLFIKGTQFDSLKRNYIIDGCITIPEVERIYSLMLQYKESTTPTNTLANYGKEIIAFIDDLELPAIFNKVLEEETDTERLISLSIEYRTIEKVKEIIQEKINRMEQQGLEAVKTTASLMAAWIFEAFASVELYLDRAPADGVELYTLRDVAMSTCRHLFVVGMNEANLPKKHRLSGYFQEHHLQELPIAYGHPTAETFTKKDEAHVQLLDLLAEQLSFSYVVGVDKSNPYLPSKFIYAMKFDRVDDPVGTIDRLQHKQGNQYTYDSELDRWRKMAFHYGLKQKVDLPEHLNNYVKNIYRIEEGKEVLQQPLKSIAATKSWWITRLESYVRCPFRFAMDYVFELSEPLKEIKRIDASKTGTMFHRIIERLYTELQLIGKPFRVCREIIEQHAEHKLFEVFEEEWTSLMNEYSEISPHHLEENKQNWLRKIRKWWAAERKSFWDNPEQENMRIFQLEKRISFTLKVDVDTQLQLTGKVDRIDIDENGFVIYDYKTSEKLLRFEDEVSKGLTIQLLLYLYGIEQNLCFSDQKEHLEILLGSPTEQMKAYGASYISTIHPLKRASNGIWREEEAISNRFGLRSAHRDVMEGTHLLEKYNLLKKIKEIIAHAAQDYSVKPFEPASCKYCAYTSICRVRDEHVAENGGEVL